jgi:RNA polymerase sigma factor (sigma-70 family)
VNNQHISDIWEKVLEGEKDALGALFNDFYNPLINYGLTLYPEKSYIKDCIQDVFLRVWNHRKNLSRVEHVRSYLFTALRRRIIELNKQNITRAERQQKYVENSYDEFLNVEQLIVQTEAKKEEKEALKKALEKLSKRQKEGIYLKFFCGFTNDEIANIMQINKQSVYNLIFKSLQKLEGYLKLTDKSFEVE